MRGSIEMNTLKHIATRAIVFVLALSILIPALVVAGDNNVVEAESLASVYLTNKGTAKTTESSPPSARANPASRSNVSTLYATMADVDTANATGNSHILDANKIVITVTESDFNTKVATTGVENDVADASATHDVGDTPVAQGLAGSPVIDSDGDGDLTDEISVIDCAEGETPVWSGTAWVGTCNGSTAVWQIVSVANGDSATNSSSRPMVTIISNVANGGGALGSGTLADTDDLYIGYYSSAVNTFDVTAWSTVQLESNASVISVVETGRNTGVFEAEFLIADTEGANDAVNATSATWDTAGNDTAEGGRCDAGGQNAAVADNAGGPGTLADGRYDRSNGVDADCEILSTNVDVAGATVAKDATAQTMTVGSLPAGQKIHDLDGDGVLHDEVFISTHSTQGFSAANLGFTVDGAIEGTGITCGGSLANCTNGTGGSIVLTYTLDGAAITDDTSDKGVASIRLENNIVDAAKVDGAAAGAISNTVSSADLLSNRVGSDTISTGGGSITHATNIKTAVPTLGTDRTPVVEAQANSTITVQYKDLTDSNTGTTATTGTKVKATATIDVSAPTPIVSSPTSGSSFKDRQPSFAGSATDIGSGIDVSTATLYIDVLDDGADTAATLESTSGSWLGGAGSINLQDEYRAVAGTLDNTTTMVDGVTSITWTISTSTNIPCLTVNDDSSTENSLGGASHTNFANVATTCATAKSEPDVSLDYFSSVTDLAGNRGFSDATTTDTNDGPSLKDNYSFNIDELKPSLDAANTETGVYWNAGTTAEKTGDATRIVVAFDDELSAAPASSFEVTTDAGTVLTPISTEIGTKGTTAAGAAYDERKNVYLTLGSALATSETPKVKLVGNVTDLAGNSNKSGNVANALDKIKPTLTLALAGGSGTGTGSDDSIGLTKKSMTFTITTSEVLSGVPTISIFSEDYGTGASYGAIGDNLDLTTTAAGASKTLTVTTMTVVDTDKDGSLLDEVVLSASTAEPPSAAELVNLAVTSVTNDGENVVIIVKNNNASALDGGRDEIKLDGNINAAYSATSDETSAEGTVTAVAVDSTTYTATFDGSDTTFSDASTKDSKAVILSANDVNSNTGTLGTRDQAASSGLYKFRLDRTAPVLVNDPDGDGTVGSSTTLPRPYVIFEFTDNSKVDVKSASFGGDDVLAKLATTNSKKYFMVPEADLTASTYAVKAKGTDLAGNAGSEGTYNLKVTSRKDYKATILAGWNLMSFPSDPIAHGVSAVFTNAGIDQVVGYDAMSKGSPWAVATKDTATGLFSGGLSSITSGNGYWVHSTEFSSQAVSLTGPEGPSASAPPSIEAISLASGWNLVGITDATKALTQANAGAVYKGVEDYLGAAGGSSVTKAFTYNTTNLAWSAKDLTSSGNDVLIGEAYWVFAKPDANGMLTPIVP
jgi:hypothetical protein